MEFHVNSLPCATSTETTLVNILTDEAKLGFLLSHTVVVPTFGSYHVGATLLVITSKTDLDTMMDKASEKAANAADDMMNYFRNLKKKTEIAAREFMNSKPDATQKPTDEPEAPGTGGAE